VRRILLVTAFASLVSCSDTPPAGRLTVGRDTLLLYGTDYTRVPVRMDEDSTAHGVMLVPRHTAILRASGHFVACLREGTTDVEARAGALTTSFVAICQFASRIAGEQYIELEPGAKPHSLIAEVSFPSGGSRRVAAFTASSSDSSVATIRDGAIMPLAVGRARLNVNYGGLRLRVGVLVQRTVFDGTATLKIDETRRWELEAGRYSITVKVNERRDLNVLNMETEGLNCSRDSRDEDTIHCVAPDRAQVMLLNRGGSAAAGSASARVRILQVP
jgi:hypothetical protein